MAGSLKSTERFEGLKTKNDFQLSKQKIEKSFDDKIKGKYKVIVMLEQASYEYIQQLKGQNLDKLIHIEMGEFQFNNMQEIETPNSTIKNTYIEKIGQLCNPEGNIAALNSSQLKNIAIALATIKEKEKVIIYFARKLGLKGGVLVERKDQGHKALMNQLPPNIKNQQQIQEVINLVKDSKTTLVIPEQLTMVLTKAYSESEKLSQKAIELSKNVNSLLEYIEKSILETNSAKQNLESAGKIEFNELDTLSVEEKKSNIEECINELKKIKYNKTDINKDDLVQLKNKLWTIVRKWPFDFLGAKYLLMYKASNLGSAEVTVNIDDFSKLKNNPDKFKYLINTFYTMVRSTYKRMTTLNRDLDTTFDYLYLLFSKMKNGGKVDKNQYTFFEQNIEFMYGFNLDSYIKFTTPLLQFKDSPDEKKLENFTKTIETLSFVEEIGAKQIDKIGAISISGTNYNVHTGWAFKITNPGNSIEQAGTFKALASLADNLGGIKKVCDIYDAHKKELEDWYKEILAKIKLLIDNIEQEKIIYTEKQNQISQTLSQIKRLDILYLSQKDLDKINSLQDKNYTSFNEFEKEHPLLHNTIRKDLMTAGIQHVEQWSYKQDRFCGLGSYEFYLSSKKNYAENIISLIDIQIQATLKESKTQINYVCQTDKITNYNELLNELKLALNPKLEAELRKEAQDRIADKNVTDKKISKTKPENTIHILVKSLEEDTTKCEDMLLTHIDNFGKSFLTGLDLQYVAGKISDVKETLTASSSIKDGEDMKTWVSGNPTVRKILSSNLGDSIKKLLSDIREVTNITNVIKVQSSSYDDLHKMVLNHDEKLEDNIAYWNKFELVSSGICTAISGTLAVAAGATTFAYPPVAPLLGILAGGVKLTGVILGCIAKHYKSKAKDNLALGDFLTAMDNFIKMLIKVSQKLLDKSKEIREILEGYMALNAKQKTYQTEIKEVLDSNKI